METLNRSNLLVRAGIKHGLDIEKTTDIFDRDI